MKKLLIKNWLKQNISGESLLEVMIALFVVTIGTATATSLIITSIKANVFNKDSLISLNLVQENLEYMRNLRDSNWLAYSADTQHCWNTSTSNGTCTPPGYTGLLIEANSESNTGGYALGLNLSSIIPQKLDLSDGITGAESNYQVNYYDLDITNDSNNDGIKNNDQDIMASDLSGAGIELVVKTKYYRSIEISYKNINAPDWSLTDAPSPVEQTADLMIVTSKVQWQDSNITHEIKISSALSKYK